MDDAERWKLLSARAGDYARVAIDNARREYPNDLRHLARGPDDRLGTPHTEHPAFFGSFDWHSCVEMHWLLVRLLRVVPGAFPAAEARDLLGAHLTADRIAGEVAYFSRAGYTAHQRPYGWAWLLALDHEIDGVAGVDAGRWAYALAPLTDLFVSRFLDWLPRATYPVRHGVHTNSAFALSRILPFAAARADAGDDRLRNAVVEAAHRWYTGDTDAPGRYEPSGTDFLSPVLVEAELMARLLDPAEFASWLHRFLPDLADERPGALFTPAQVSDATDGYIAHLHGLNLSRAWCWRRIAEALPEHDRRIGPVMAAAGRHAATSLPVVSGAGYATEHWLAAYAVLLLT